MISTMLQRMISRKQNLTREELIKKIYVEASDAISYIVADAVDKPELMSQIIPVVDVRVDARRLGPVVFELCGDILEGRDQDLRAELGAHTFDFHDLSVSRGSDENEFVINVAYNELSRKKKREAAPQEVNDGPEI